MTTKLIGLTGKAGSGKDEVAKILWAEQLFLIVHYLVRPSISTSVSAQEVTILTIATS